MIWRAISAGPCHSVSGSPGLEDGWRCKTGAHIAFGGDSFLTFTSTDEVHVLRSSEKAARRCMSLVPSQEGH